MKNIFPPPDEIILRNGGENMSLFRSSLENELKDRYDIPISVDSEKEGYLVDVGAFMRLYND